MSTKFKKNDYIVCEIYPYAIIVERILDVVELPTYDGYVDTFYDFEPFSDEHWEDSRSIYNTTTIDNFYRLATETEIMLYYKGNAKQ